MKKEKHTVLLNAEIYTVQLFVKSASFFNKDTSQSNNLKDRFFKHLYTFTISCKYPTKNQLVLPRQVNPKFQETKKKNLTNS